MRIPWVEGNCAKSDDIVGVFDYGFHPVLGVRAEDQPRLIEFLRTSRTELDLHRGVRRETLGRACGRCSE
jgi:hypothetical protein